MIEYLDAKLLGVIKPNTKAWAKRIEAQNKRYNRFYQKNGTGFGFTEKEQRRTDELMVYKLIGRLLLGAGSLLGTEVIFGLYKIARTN